MENNRVITEVENIKTDLEYTLANVSRLLKKVKGYDSFKKSNKSADIVLYLLEAEELNEEIDKKLYNALIRSRALTDILENEVKSFQKK